MWVGSLAARFGWDGWSTWGIYLVTGVLQGCLLVMGIVFESRARRDGMGAEEGVIGNGNRHVDEADGDPQGHVNGEQDHERTGLLANER